MKLTQDIHKAAAEALAHQPVTLPRAQYDALMGAAKALDEARLLLNIAFGEYACCAKYLPAEERAQFERNYAVNARALIDVIAENDAALRAAGLLEEGEKG